MMGLFKPAGVQKGAMNFVSETFPQYRFEYHFDTHRLFVIFTKRANEAVKIGENIPPSEDAVKTVVGAWFAGWEEGKRAGPGGPAAPLIFRA